MLAHALAMEGIASDFQPAAEVNADYLAKLDLKGANVVCLSYFTPRPGIPARHGCRRLRRRWPDVRIVLALWNAPPEVLTNESIEALKADAVVTSVEEGVRRIHRIVNPEEAKAVQEASLPDNDATRVDALKATEVLEGDKRETLDALAKRAADVFNTSVAVISTIRQDREYFVGQVESSRKQSPMMPGRYCRWTANTRSATTLWATTSRWWFQISSATLALPITRRSSYGACAFTPAPRCASPMVWSLGRYAFSTRTPYP